MDESDESETWVKLISKIESFDCCFQMEVLTGEEGTEDEEEEEEEEEDEEEEEEDEVSFLLKTVGIVFFSGSPSCEERESFKGCAETGVREWGGRRGGGGGGDLQEDL